MEGVARNRLGPARASHISPEALNPKPQTPNPKPKTLDPKP